MSTSKQTEANRQNAQKSTGPRSPEGKAASRFNALKSGIDAKSQVLPDEDPDQLEVLVAEYQERFSTATPERRLLVDTLVNSEWLLRRLTRAEAEFWQYEAHRTESEYSSNEHPIGRVLYFGDRVFDRLQRRVDAINRNYHRALKELQRLEAAEQPVECPSGAGLQACPATTPEHSDPPATEVPAPKLGSFRKPRESPHSRVPSSGLKTSLRLYPLPNASITSRPPRFQAESRGLTSEIGTFAQRSR
jgi:hypothetical protein